MILIFKVYYRFVNIEIVKHQKTGSVCPALFANAADSRGGKCGGTGSHLPHFPSLVNRVRTKGNWNDTTRNGSD